MTRDQAERQARERGPGHLARERDGAWEVVRITLPGGLAPAPPVSATTEARPKPPQADDPRPANFRQIGPFGAA